MHFYAKGLVALALTNKSSAFENFLKATELNCDNLESSIKSIQLYFQGCCHYLLENHEAALKILEESIKIDDEQADSLFLKGTILAKSKLYDTAIESLSRVLEINSIPDKIEVLLFLRGALHLEKGENQLAFDDFTDAIEWSSNDAKIYSNRGLALIRLNRLKEAISDLERSLHLDSSIIETHWYYGLACILCGDLSAAKAQFEIAYSLNCDQTKEFIKGYFSNIESLKNQDPDNTVSYQLILNFLSRLS